MFLRIHQLYYHVKHKYFTLNNVVVMIAAGIAISWIWGSVAIMQRNYDLQAKYDTKQRERQLYDLEVATLQYEQKYMQSDEYKELMARRKLGLGMPGEKVIILPENTATAKQDTSTTTTVQTQQATEEPSIPQQWYDFLSGKNVAERLQSSE